MPSDKCTRCGRRVPWLSFAGNLTMTVYKVIVGVLGGSSALVADGLHSLTDVVGTSAILFTQKVARQPADEDHPYGHGKAEFMGSAFIYTVLVFLSIGIFSGGALMIWSGDLRTPRFVTMLAAGVSVLYNVVMFKLGKCAGKQNNSPGLLANAYENRADAVSSAACIIGIAAAMTIHPICDPIAAMLVGVVIFVNCIIQLKESIGGLMDQSLPVEVTERIERIALKQDHVERVSSVRTRQTGTKYWIDLEVIVSPDLDAATAQEVARSVRTELMRRSEKFHRVEVYVTSDSSEEEEGDKRGIGVLQQILSKQQEEVTDVS